MASAPYSIPLNGDFRFVHEPLDYAAGSQLDRFVGRSEELDELVARILLSAGGAFLLTGYRGVGKSTFVNRVIAELRARVPELEPMIGHLQLVDVRLNIPRAMTPVELMYHILRGLYLRLVALHLLYSIDPVLRHDLELAFARTSRSIALKTTASLEGTTGVTLGAPLPGILQSSSGISLGSKRSRGRSEEIAYLAYDDKAAEYDLIDISRRLTQGFAVRQRWPARVLARLTGRQPPLARLKVLLVFDELDKIDDRNAGGLTIDDVLANLKTLFTTSGIAFLFVAGKDVHERWLEDIGRGDSIYESVFSYALYLPPLWMHADPMCDPLLDRAAFQAVDALELASAYAAFKKFLAFNGRGIPRRILRKFNERVKWAAGRPQLWMSRDDVRQFRFFAELYDVLLQAEPTLLGELREDAASGRMDRKRLGLYYLVDWILLRGNEDFTLQDAIDASRSLSRVIALAEQAAPDIIRRLLALLVKQQYLDVTTPARTSIHNEAVPAADVPARYRLMRKRLVEMGSLAGVVEPEARAVAEETRSETFGGRYDVASVLGRGGMSTVYLANDRVTGRQVAIKERLAHLESKPESRERFTREVHALSRLQHENVVRIYDFDAKAPRPFIVMEYVEGVRLADAIESGALTDESERVALAHEIVRTLEYVHERGVLWRDPKPSNIMITRDGRVVLLDFGISRTLASPDPDSGMLVGTPTYSSPEQLRGEPLDVRSDIYGVGLVLYEMITGHVPFEGNDAAAAYRRVRERPQPPSHYAPVSPAFERVVMRCLDPDKELRFATAAELLTALPPHAVPAAAVSPIFERVPHERMRQDRDQSRITRATVISTLDTAGSRPSTTVDEVQSASLVMPDGTVRELAPPRVRIGRSQDNDIVLSEPAASRFQAELALEADGWVLRDLNARNTTMVNGAAVTAPLVLRDGHVVRMGGTTLIFRLAAADTAADSRGRSRKLFDFIADIRDGAVRVEDVANLVLDSAIQVTGAERAFVMLADETGTLAITDAKARGGVSLPGTTFSTSVKIPQEVLRTREVTVVADLLDDDLADAHMATVALGIRHVACAPIPSPDHERPLGVLYLDSREKGFWRSNAERDALRTLSAELAHVIWLKRQLTVTQPRDAAPPEPRPSTRGDELIPPVPEYAGSYYQASIRNVPVSGNRRKFCRFVEIDIDHVGFVIGDAVGKGGTAGAIAGLVLDTIDARVKQEMRPSQILTAINQVLVAERQQSRYTTLFFGVLGSDGTVTYCNAGHTPPLVVRASGVERLETGGFATGLFERVEYSDGVVTLAEGETLVAVSDDVTEAVNESSEAFGEARVIATVRERDTDTTPGVADALVRSLAEFRGSKAPDNASVLVVRFAPDGIPSSGKQAQTRAAH